MKRLLPHDAARAAKRVRISLEDIRWRVSHGKRLERFRALHRGEDCFILGNGPSLNRMDLRPLREYHTFGLNKIYLMQRQVDLNLSYHVAVNKLVVRQSALEFQRLPCPSFVSFDAARGVLPAAENIYYIRTGGLYTFASDATRRIHEGHTVTYVALQLAFFMGFRRAVLIGVDHSFVSNGNPNERQRLVGADPNHFDPSYFANQDWQLPDLDASELSYHLADFFYRRHGRQILDATVDGKLQRFPKISFEAALELLTPKSAEHTRDLVPE